MNGKMERVKSRIDEIKKEREELKEKYDYLVEQMKKAIDKHSQDIGFLKNEVKSMANKEAKDEEKISNLRSFANSLEKSINSVDGKLSVMKEKLKEEVDLASGKLDSEISEKMKLIQNKLVDDLKIEIDKSLEGLQVLEKDVKKLQDKGEKHGERISNLRSSINSLGKSLANIEGRYSILKEKMNEDMKLMGEGIDSKLSERLKAMESSLRAMLKDGMRKNADDIRSLRADMKNVIERDEEYGDKFSGVSEDLNSVKKSISELSGMQDVLKEEVNEKVNLFEREISSELSKVRGMEERLGKDVEGFEKFAGEQKARMEKFESNVSNKIDMFAVEKENVKRDFTSISNDFKNIGSRMDSLKEKDSDLNQRLQNVELGLDNFKNTTEEVLSKTKEEQIVFKENLVAKLNEANEKILNRLSQNEIRTSSELSKQSEDIKLFRAHVTQFVNELVSNYDKRFEVMKSEINNALRILEERSKEQRAMIFE